MNPSGKVTKLEDESFDKKILTMMNKIEVKPLKDQNNSSSTKNH
jgi:hypothetical protein